MKTLAELKMALPSSSFTSGAASHFVFVIPLFQEITAKDLVRKLDSLEEEPSIECKDSKEARLHLKRLKSA